MTLITHTQNRDTWQELYVGGSLSVGDDGTWQLADLPTDWQQAEGYLRLFGDRAEEAATALADRYPVLQFSAVRSPAVTPGTCGVFGLLFRGEPESIQRFPFPQRGTCWQLTAPDIRLTYAVDCGATVGNRVESYRASYEALLEGLAERGCLINTLVRTWCYFDDVLADYDGFNRVRQELLTSHGVAQQNAPASTGIQGNNRGRFLTLDALAAEGSAVSTAWLTNPTQMEAWDYGSWFARGARISTPATTQWLVSGMAAIDTSGKSIHVGDALAQMQWTLGSADAFLHHYNLTRDNVVSAIAYFAPATAAELIPAFAQEWPSHVPVTLVIADVCRADLDFEIELIAFSD